VSPAPKVGPAHIVAVTATTRQDDESRRVRLTASYVDALENAGLVPLIVPPLSNHSASAAILDSVDGLLLTGGEDVNPALFGQKPHPNLKTVNDQRDTTEIALIQEARRRHVPILAICRGIQVLNVALGGTLIQDIPAQRENALNHDDGGGRKARVHEISVSSDSLTAKALGTSSCAVNSLHHQAVGTVAPELRVVARSPDGIIEALETNDPDWWVVAVQWHPEEMTDSPEPWDRGLFKAFAERLSRGA